MTLPLNAPSSLGVPAALPRLLPAAPGAGKKALAPPLAGSSDALALAQYASAAAERNELLVVIGAEALALQRLAAEIAWFAPALRVAVLPDWETLPYDHFSPHQDLVSDRLAALYRVSRGECDVLLVAATTALYRLAPPSYLAAYTFFLAQGEKLDVDALRAQLALGGYQHVTQVVAAGEYSVRGGLIDLFPMGSGLPYRIDLFDNEIESIKSFDVDNQRTLYPVPNVRMLPAREFPQDDSARTRFRGRFREVFEGDPSKSGLYRDISNGVTPGGIEYYLPLFFDATATLADYVPASATVCVHGPVAAAAERFWQDTESRYRLLRGDPARPLLPPHELFLPVDEFNAVIKRFARIELGAAAHGAERDDGRNSPTQALPALQVDRRAGDPLSALKRFATATRERVLIVADGLGRRETMQQYFAEYGFKPALVGDWAEFAHGDASPALTVGPAHAGFIWPEGGVALITEAELYADVVRSPTRRDARRTNVEAMLRDLSEVRIGDPVVHEEHGIGRYLGLVTLDLGDGPNEFLHLQYANDAKLYVPVASLHLISRYSGAAPEAAPLHELGSGQWDKAKRKAAQRAHDTAAELLNLYAQRAAREGHAFRFDIHDYEAFADGFPFEETPDQAGAIEAVIKDMVTGKPMDRLVCGDVGFGKTEVALRAAFIAVADGHQVGVLVPTTLLAEQHSRPFRPLRQLAGEARRAVALSHRQGGPDGARRARRRTHRHRHRHPPPDPGGRQVQAPGPGHHRRGAPLRGAPEGAAEAPARRGRRAHAHRHADSAHAGAVARGPARFLGHRHRAAAAACHQDLRRALRARRGARSRAARAQARRADLLPAQRRRDDPDQGGPRCANWCPRRALGIAHGQMPERELEHVMRDFYQQRCNLLLCSTIIETGIDVPTANTIIIDRADRFGLAQLHQLRGRVGRSHHQAYAYLLTPPEEALSAQAKKRLEAIQLMEELGSGFYLAMHDLEIRGAGEVLGEEQSGEMQQIGFQLYVDMLKAAVDALKAGREPDLTEPLGVTTEINLHVPALLPETYCSDVHERLVLYKRLANCTTPAELVAMQEELVDRFGLPPEPTRALLACHRLRIESERFGVIRIDSGPERTQLQFGPHADFDPARLIALIARDGRYRLAGQDRVRVERAAPSLEERVTLVRELLGRLG